MRIVELREGHYHLAQEGDRYYLAFPEDHVVKLKPREVKDYLRWGGKALEQLIDHLDHQGKLAARSLAGVDLGYALHRHRVEHGLPVLVTRDGHHEWEVVSPDSLAPAPDAPMRRVIDNPAGQWSFYEMGEGRAVRCFLAVRWTWSAAMDMILRLELAPEEVAAWKARGRAWLDEFVARCQGAGADSDILRRRLDRYDEDASELERAERAALVRAMEEAPWTGVGGRA